MAEWGGVLAIPELDRRFLHNHCSDPETDCGRLLGSTPAMQWYKIRPCHIETHTIAVFCAGCIMYHWQAGNILLDGGYLHNRVTDFDSVCGRLLGLMPAFQQYKIPPCHIKVQEITVYGRGDLYSSPSNIVLNGRLLHSRSTDFAALCRGLLGSTPAFQWYEVHLGRIGAHEFTVFCGGCIMYQAGDILLDGRLLHDRSTDSDTLCVRLLAMTQASQ